MMTYLLKRAMWAALVAAFAFLSQCAQAQGVVFARAAALAVPSASGWTISSLAADAGFGAMMARNIGPAAAGATEFSKLLAKPYTGMAAQAFEAQIARNMAAPAIAKAARGLDSPAVAGMAAASIIFDAVTSERWYPSANGWVKDDGTDPLPGDPNATSPAMWCESRAGNNRGNRCAIGPSGSSYQTVLNTSMTRILAAFNTSQGLPHSNSTAWSVAGPATYTASYDTIAGTRTTQRTTNNAPCGQQGLPACFTNTLYSGVDATVFAYCPNDPEGAIINVGGQPSCRGTPPGCPASVDALNPALSVPAGAAPMADGKCRTGRYNAKPAAAFDEMGGRLFRGAVGQAIAETILNTPGGRIDTGPGTLTGPSVLDGPTAVRTEPAPGGGVTTITEHDEWKLGYLTPDAITKTPKRTTTTCPPSGDCSTTTQEEPTPVGGGSGVSPDYCLEHPERVGCQELDDPGTEKPEWSVKDVPFTIEDLGLPSGCPADRTFTVRTWVLPLHWQPLCDAAPIARPGIIALAAFGAFIFVVANVKA